MPTNRTRTKRRRIGSEGLNDAAFSYFWWGGTLHAGDGYEWGLSHTGTEKLDFWKTHKDEILAAYIERVRSRGWPPGKRPFIFWAELEIIEERRKIGTRKYQGPMTKDGCPEPEFLDVFEEDYDFLKRLDLLIGWEKTAKRPEAYYEKLNDLYPVIGECEGPD